MQQLNNVKSVLDSGPYFNQATEQLARIPKSKLYQVLNTSEGSEILEQLKTILKRSDIEKISYLSLTRLNDFIKLGRTMKNSKVYNSLVSLRTAARIRSMKQIQQKTGRQMEELVERQIRNRQKVETEVVTDLNPSEVIESNLSPIEQSVLPYRKALTQTPTLITSNQVPASVRFLARFGEAQNLIPMGQATDKPGNVYVCLKTTDQDGMNRTIPLNQVPDIEGTIPDIPMQMRYHAYKTASSWNRFVEDEAKLVEFVNQIKSPSDRLSFIQNQFKSLSNQTFYAQALATLTYFYVYLPLNLYITKHLRQINPLFSESDFYDTYEVPRNPHENPFLCGNEVGKAMAKILLNFGKTGDVPLNVLTQIKTLLKQEKNTFNKDQVEYFMEYEARKQFQAKAFFRKNGISESQQTQIFGLKSFYGIKKKSFTVPQPMKNGQIVQLINKVVLNESTSTENTLWDQRWGSSYLYCHNYVWK